MFEAPPGSTFAQPHTESAGAPGKQAAAGGPWLMMAGVRSLLPSEPRLFSPLSPFLWGGTRRVGLNTFHFQFGKTRRASNKLTGKEMPTASRHVRTH